MEAALEAQQPLAAGAACQVGRLVTIRPTALTSWCIYDTLRLAPDMTASWIGASAEYVMADIEPNITNRINSGVLRSEIDLSHPSWRDRSFTSLSSTTRNTSNTISTPLNVYS